MKIISRSKYQTYSFYRREFNDAQHGTQRFVSGYGFPCDEHGNVDEAALNPTALKSLQACLSGSVDGRAVLDLGVAKYEQQVRIPAVGSCNSCQRRVTLSGFTNTCECGADYNTAGQQLAARSQWGEETGECAADILSREDY